ncbi:MAG: NAD+ synthase [Luteitalea sp.]|nr:NAD+ synthase [Luteitalea sp.]
MRIALLQLNPIVGDLEGNAARIRAAVERSGSDVDLCVTPEMSLTGYPPRDLLLQPGFVRCAGEQLDLLADALRAGPAVLVGLPQPNPASVGRPLFNTAALVEQGRVALTFTKSLLPTYDVFDEDRYFEPGRGVESFEPTGTRIAVSICEDVWNDRDFWRMRRYHRDPIEEASGQGARALVNLSASPFASGKQQLREAMLSSLARKHRMALLYVNQVGANDDLIFDGRSMAFDADGRLIARGAAFAEDLVIVDLDRATVAAPPPPGENVHDEEELFEALTLGTRDYARKCGFDDAVIGLSGGIDSALTAVIAARALGPNHLLGVLMPSPYSSQGSLEDAQTLASRLGLRTLEIPIATIMESYGRALCEAFEGRAADVTEENIQARIRGNLLMSLANKFGALLLTTGNKSELAVGYCTLYGDMSGGLAVIADVPKTMVYRVARWVNREEALIPSAILTKAPSAELRPNQTDQDSLPPYDVLDRILERHIEDHASVDSLVAEGFDDATVRHVLRLVRVAEFKRKQAAPGLKVTDRAFGSGWRMPIARADWERAYRGEGVTR